jgi:hypothetical protein
MLTNGSDEIGHHAREPLDQLIDDHGRLPQI